MQVAAVWLVLAGVATYLFFVDPAKGTGYPSCPFRTLTGLQCPGCGTSRSLHQLLNGHPIAAFELNPLMITALPIVLLLLLTFSSSALTTHGHMKVRFRPWFAWVLFAVVVGFWIFRNTTLYPFAS